MKNNSHLKMQVNLTYTLKNLNGNKTFLVTCCLPTALPGVTITGSSCFNGNANQNSSYIVQPKSFTFNNLAYLFHFWQ